MPNTPLNPDAIEHAIKEVYGDGPRMDWPSDMTGYQTHRDYARTIVEQIASAYLAAAQPVVNSVEELDALPIGSVILSERYIARQEGEEYPGVFQKLYTGDWHRGGRSSDTHPDYFLPARVLYRPEVKP